jgi:hypothetical protein
MTVNNELYRMWKEAVVAWLVQRAFCLDELRKVNKNIRQGSWCTRCDSKPAPQE